MIQVAVEVREDAALSRLVVRARSISHALDIAQGGLSKREVRVVFPIEAEGFFEPGQGSGDAEDASDILVDHTLAGGHREEGGVPERRLARRGDAD